MAVKAAFLEQSNNLLDFKLIYLFMNVFFPDTNAEISSSPNCMFMASQVVKITH